MKGQLNEDGYVMDFGDVKNVLFIFIELLICSIYIIRDKFIDHAMYCKGTAGHRIN